MRRRSSLGILLLAVVLSVSHYKISLLPSARQQDPRPSRAELPSRAASAAVETAGMAAPLDRPTGSTGFLPRLIVVPFTDPESRRLVKPDYLQPHVFGALIADLPPPALLAPRS